jgi:hypothetical protein
LLANLDRDELITDFSPRNPELRVLKQELATLISVVPQSIELVRQEQEHPGHFFVFS